MRFLTILTAMVAIVFACFFVAISDPVVSVQEVRISRQYKTMNVQKGECIPAQYSCT